MGKGVFLLSQPRHCICPNGRAVYQRQLSLFLLTANYLLWFLKSTLVSTLYSPMPEDSINLGE